MTPEQHRAFAAALEELFRRYPLPEYKHRKTAWQREYDRSVAIWNARKGDPLWMIEIFAHKVPLDEIRAIHTLIYG